MSLSSDHMPCRPELELVAREDRSVHAFHHGVPSPLVRWHCHDDYELHMIVASVGKVFVGDHVGAFAPGQLVLTGPRLPHNWITQSGEGESVAVRDLVVQFRSDLVSTMVGASPELRELLPLLDRARYGIEFRGEARTGMQAWFERMFEADGPARIALLIECLARLGTATDYRLLSTLPMRSEADDVALDKVETVTQYVAEHHAREIPLESVAALVGMSPSAFSRFFAKATGNGFSRFVNRVRIAKACELLAGTDDAITGICFEVGFNNVANFNRRFREQKSVTPREYRRQARLRHVSARTDPGPRSRVGGSARG